MIQNYRLQKFDESGKLVPGKVFGLCSDCLPLVERKITGGEVLTPADYDKTPNPCFRCKAEVPPPRPITRRTDPPTAHEAAASLSDADLSKIDGAIVGALRARADGLTTRELADITGIERVSVSPRMARLAERSVVYDSGETRISPDTNKKGIVWKLRNGQTN
jgi:hypothetical protein